MRRIVTHKRRVGVRSSVGPPNPHPGRRVSRRPSGRVSGVGPLLCVVPSATRFGGDDLPLGLSGGDSEVMKGVRSRPRVRR